MIQARILDLELRASSGVTALFGAPGAGKTAILDAIAGLTRPAQGRILIDDQILFDGASGIDLPPRLRPCGYVFRDHALLPHMTLRQNLLFAAACRRLPRLESHRRVNEMLERFRLADASGRRPAEVSEDQKQRCSMARALLGRPRLLLVDQPSPNFHALLRAESAVPMLLATRDLDTCIELGAEMLVLHQGRLVQSGSPREIMQQPATVEVARLLGTFNLLPAEITALDPGRKTSRLRLDSIELSGPYFPGHLRGDKVTLCMRPDELLVQAAAGKPGVNQLSAQLLRVVERPQTVKLHFAGEITAELSRADYERQKHNREWLVEFPAQQLRVL